MTRPHMNVVIGESVRTYILCPNCDGQGWVPDKPWKGEHRNWMRCHDCENPGGLDEPDHPPTNEDWERQER